MYTVVGTIDIDTNARVKPFNLVNELIRFEGCDLLKSTTSEESCTTFEKIRFYTFKLGFK